MMVKKIISKLKITTSYPCLVSFNRVRCEKCTRFYVYSNSVMSLIKDTTTLNYFQMIDSDISHIFSDVKKIFVHLNVYYRASDFINHGPE